MNAKAKGAGGGGGEEAKKTVKRKKITEIRDSVWVILLRLLLIQGVPLIFMCICCKKLYQKRRELLKDKDNHFHHQPHSHA